MSIKIYFSHIIFNTLIIYRLPSSLSLTFQKRPPSIIAIDHKERNQETQILIQILQSFITSTSNT